MAENVLNCVLAGTISTKVLMKWLLGTTYDDETNIFGCTKSNFVQYFLDFLRVQTSVVLQPHTSCIVAASPSVSSKGSTNPCITEKKESQSIDEINRSRSYEPNVPQNSTQRLNVFSTPNKTDGCMVLDKNSSNVIIKPFSSLNIYNEHSGDPSCRYDNTRLQIGPILNQNNGHLTKSKTHVNSKSQNPSERRTINLGDFIIKTCSGKKKKHSNSSNTADKTLNSTDSSPSCNKNTPRNKNTNHSAIPNDGKDFLKQDFPEINALPCFSRRIKPTLLTNTNLQFGTPVQSTETNSVFQMENHLENSSNFDNERNLLKTERCMIQKLFGSNKQSKPIQVTSGSSVQIAEQVTADVTQVSCITELNTLCEIYIGFLDYNFLTNIVTEIAFLFSLLNIDRRHTASYLLNGPNDSSQDDPTKNIITTIHNCVYFASRVLNSQRRLLSFLDQYTLKNLQENVHIKSFTPDLSNFLLEIYTERSSNKIRIESNVISDANVCFQIDTDNRENFTSAKTFQIFRKQRDLFYEILRFWETKHSQPDFSFSHSLSSKVTALLQPLENKGKPVAVRNPGFPNSPNNHKTHNVAFHTAVHLSNQNVARNTDDYNSTCNMAHLARLFVHQMLASCENDYVECNPLVLDSLPPGIDPNKLSRLSNRLVSANIDDVTAFTGHQQFFRDFILCSEHYIFLEHLKVTLSSKLLELNDSSNPDETEIKEYDANTKCNDKELKAFILKTTNSLRVLAKFLGFVCDLPFNSNGSKVRGTQETICVVREKTQPVIDFYFVIVESKRNYNLTLTIQWLTVYLAMLDYTTLLLECYKKVINELFEIYALCFHNKADAGSQCLIKLLLGWLFDLPNFPHNYYDWRFNRNELMELDKDYIFLSNSIEYPVAFCPYFERILYQAVPSLSSLKNALGGANRAQSGRVKHVTPLSQPIVNRVQQSASLQSQLAEHFFHGQPSSVRKMIEFITERVYSAIVKQLVGFDLTKARDVVSASVENVIATDRQEIEMQLNKIYSNNLKILLDNASKTVPALCEHRIQMATQCLFPSDMLEPVQDMCVKICTKRTVHRCQEWICEHINDTSIFCKDMNAEVNKILTKNQNNICDTALSKNIGGNVKCNFNCPSPAEILIGLKDLISDMFENPRMDKDNIMSDVTLVLSRIVQCLDQWNDILFAPLRNIAFLSVDLLVLLICHCPHILTADVLEQFKVIWNNVLLKPFVKNDTVHEDARHPKLEIESVTELVPNVPDDDMHIFNRILCPRNVFLLGGCYGKSESWNVLATVLLNLLVDEFLNVNSLEEQCIKLLRLVLPKDILINLSRCITEIINQAKKIKPEENHKATWLWLESLADLYEDMVDY